MKLLNVLPAFERFSVQPVWRQCRRAKESLTRQKLKRPRKARRRGNAKGRNIVCVTLIYERISGLWGGDSKEDAKGFNGTGETGGDGQKTNKKALPLEANV